VSSFSRNKFRSIEVVSGPALVPTLGLTVLAVFAQTLFARFALFHGTVPSLVTIAVVLYSVKAGAGRGALLGVFAGSLEDSLAGSGGAWTIATTLMGLAAGTVARGFFSDGFVMLGGLVALGIVLRDTVFWVVMSLEGYPRGLARTHVHSTLWQAAITGLCALLYLVLRTRFIADRTAVERFP